jgi:hypothetical protein
MWYSGVTAECVADAARLVHARITRHSEFATLFANIRIVVVVVVVVVVAAIAIIAYMHGHVEANVTATAQQRRNAEIDTTYGGNLEMMGNEQTECFDEFKLPRGEVQCRLKEQQHMQSLISDQQHG